jgi:hypothetical protein
VSFAHVPNGRPELLPEAGAPRTLEAVRCKGWLRLSKNPESPETWIHKPLIFHDRTLRKNQQLAFFDSLVRRAQMGEWHP